MDSEDAIFAWLVEWAAASLTSFVVRSGGETSYAKIGGETRNDIPIASVGERVCYLPLKSCKRDRSTADRLKVGVWLGLRLRSNEALTGT